MRAQECDARLEHSLARDGRGGAHYFAHQADGLVIGIAEEGQPQVVIGHLRDHVRFLHELNPSRDQQIVRPLNVRNAKVQYGPSGARHIGRSSEGEADFPALEERHWTRIEEKLHPEHVLIEILRPLEIADSHGDLADFIEMDRRFRSVRMHIGLTANVDSYLMPFKSAGISIETVVPRPGFEMILNLAWLP